LRKKFSWKVSGIQGLQGLQGIQGIPGLSGPVGSIGAKGEAGVKGDVGARGDRGQQGDVGITGTAGEKGETGATGVAGVAGEKGDTGATGATGATGQNGQSGYSSIWFSPRDLVSSNSANTKSFVSRVLISGYLEEVLNSAQVELAFIWRATPKGWGNASSTTWKIFWTTATEAQGKKVGFGIFVSSGSEGTRLYPDLAPACNTGCSGYTGKTALSPGVMNVTTIINPNSNVTGFTEGGIMHLAFERGSTLFSNGTFTADDVFQGDVYVFGVSAQANF
jgi:hypothetical protein